ncbi:MAG: hypothetical protein ACYTBJ_00260 [Planctomycetota bacterium]|jgi:hypothetical protein
MSSSKCYKPSKVHYGDSCEHPGCDCQAVDAIKVDGAFQKLCRDHLINDEPPYIPLVHSSWVDPIYLC